MIRNTTQQSTKGLDQCASSLLNADARETMQRMKCKTQQPTGKAEQQPVTQIKGNSLKSCAFQQQHSLVLWDRNRNRKCHAAEMWTV